MDPGLIRRAQDGDVESFTALITGRVAALTRTAMAILGHEADARDAVAETIATVWRELPRLRDVDAFEACAIPCRDFRHADHVRLALLAQGLPGFPRMRPA